jgi:acetyl esterase/lipase
MRLKQFEILFIFLVFASSALAQKAEPTFTSNISYAKIDSIDLQLNIAIPDLTDNNSRHKFPLIIFIHGGGWREGHRNAYNGQIKKAAKKGFVAATISHRLTSIEDKNGKPLYPWPAAIHDCKAAIRFLKANASAYNIDTTKIGVTGASSGGHLALMLGLTNPSHKLEGNLKIHSNNNKINVSTKVHAVVNISGPTEMISCHKAPIVTPYSEYLLQGSPANNRADYIEASPVTYLRKNILPIMTLHGELDDVVPFEQALILDEMIKKLGGNHELQSFENQGHVFNKEAAQKSWELLYKFFEKNLD